MLTQKILKEHLHYNSVTGNFTWIKKSNKCSNNIDIGSIAGSINEKGYIVIGFLGKVYKAHRLAWLYIHGYFPIQIDHIDHNRSNNSLNNLRVAHQVDNCKNRSKPFNNTSGIVGVSWHASQNKWKVYINVNKKKKSLGTFEYKWDAICARKSAEIKYGYHPNHGK